MPGMDVASASVAFIQFSVSTVQAIKQLHDFIQALRDAPKTVKKLADELALLGRIIEEVRNGGDRIRVIEASTLDGFNSAEQLVRGIVERLHEKLFRNLPHGRDSSQRRFLKSLKSVLSKDDVKEGFAVLERAKTLLLLAQGALHLQCNQETRRQLQTLSEGQKLISSASAPGPVIIQYISQSATIDNSIKYDISTKGTSNRRSEQEPEVEAYSVSRDFHTDIRNFASNQNLGPKKAQLLEFYLEKALEYVAKQDPQIELGSEEHAQIGSAGPRSSVMIPQEKSNLGSQLLDVSRRRANEYSFSSSRHLRVTTVYDHPWIGKIAVRRRTKHAKQWNLEDGTFENLRVIQTTTLELKPAPWLLLPYASIEVQVQWSQSINEVPATILRMPDSFPYFQMPEELGNAIAAGNLSILQHAVSENMIPLRGRDHKGRTLLDISLEAFGDDDTNTAFDPPSHIGDLLKTARWLYAQGVRTEMSNSHFVLENHIYLSACDDSGDVAANVFNMEQLLIDVTADAPAIRRAKTLLHFAILNADHSTYLECVISDIIDDAVSVDENHCAQDLAKLESELVDLRARWAPITSGYDDFPMGLEHLLLLSWIRLRRLSISVGDDINTLAERFGHLKGPRYILLKSFLLRPEPYFTKSQVIHSVANWLKLCRKCTPTILEDGFGDFLSTVACRSNLLDMWHEVLHHAGYPAKEIISRHLSADEHIRKPLRVRLERAECPNSTNLYSIALTATDPHGSVTMRYLEGVTEPHKELVFDSHETLSSPEICLVRQLGTELHFDCGITDPSFDAGYNWELERDYFCDFEETMEYYAEEDVYADIADPEEQLHSGRAKGANLLSSMASRTASVLSTIV